MESENLEARLAELAEDVKQMEARMDARLDSLKEELKAEISELHFAQVRDVSLLNVEMLWRTTNTASLIESFDRAYKKINRLAEQYKDSDEKDIAEFQREINNISEAAGIGRIWEV